MMAQTSILKLHCAIAVWGLIMSIIDCSKNKAKRHVRFNATIDEHYEFVAKVDGEVVDDFDDWGLSWACKDLEDLLARKEASTGPSLERLGMRTPRVVNVHMVVSGQTVVWVWQRPEHE